jgi:FHS family L-fucose permease-like MFS transporter
MAIPMMGYALALIFPIYVNLFQRERMDTHRVAEVGIATTKTQKEYSVESGGDGEKRDGAFHEEIRP